MQWCAVQWCVGPDGVGWGVVCYIKYFIFQILRNLRPLEGNDKKQFLDNSAIVYIYFIDLVIDDKETFLILCIKQ